MLIKTIDKYTYQIVDQGGSNQGLLHYANHNYMSAGLQLSNGVHLNLLKRNSFSAVFSLEKEKREIGRINISIKNSILLQLEGTIARYLFKKTGFWKTRFVLYTKENEELLAVLPIISWNKNSYTFTLQINEEMIAKIDNLLILLTLHCTIYSLVMMYEGVY
jgi:hypothetical protein